MIGDDVDRVLTKLQQLVAVPSVVGYEGPLMRHLARELHTAGLDVTSSEGGVVGNGARGGRVVISAHADRHGLICTAPGTFTYAAHVLPAIRGVANSHRHAFAETVCTRFGDEEVRAYDPRTGNTVADGRVDHMAVCGIDDLGIEVPVKGLDAILTATPVAFQGKVVQEGKHVQAQLDNVLGVAMALVLVEGGFDGTVVFTAEEEIGASWRYLNHELLRHVQAPDTLIVLDTSPCDDTEAVDVGAVVLRWRDETARFSVPTVSRLIQISQSHDIPVVVKDRLIERLNEERRFNGRDELPLGRTELGRLVRGTAEFVNGATLQVPTTMYHTNAETTSVTAIANAMRVLRDATD